MLVVEYAKACPSSSLLTAGRLGRTKRTTNSFADPKLLRRPDLARPGRRQFVGLVPTDGRSLVPEGGQIVGPNVGQIVKRPPAGTVTPSLGHVTASLYSPSLEHPIALALVADGRARKGDLLTAVSPLHGLSVEVTVTEPVFLDPEGTRLRG